MKFLFFTFVFTFFAFFSAQAQFKSMMENKKIFKTVLDSSSHNKRVVNFLLPYTGYDPETSLAFGFNTSSVFLTDTLSDRYSSIYTNLGYSLKKQLTIILSHSIFTKSEKWFLKGRINYLDYPLTIYEIGNRTPQESAEKIYSNGFLFYQKILKRIKKDVFFGIQYRFHELKNIESQEENGWFNTYKPLGYNNFKISGLGTVFKIDTRNNTQSASKGILFNASYYLYSELFLSDYNFSTLDIDIRLFTSPFEGKNTVLAFWLYNSFSKGDVVWKELPQTGIYGTTRGYVKGRYRSDYFLSYEMELRTQIWWRWYGIAFAGISTVSQNKQLPQYWNPNVGFGFRFLLKNKEQLYTGFDFAWGKDNNKGIYVRLGQAF